MMELCGVWEYRHMGVWVYGYTCMGVWVWVYGFTERHCIMV